MAEPGQSTLKGSQSTTVTGEVQLIKFELEIKEPPFNWGSFFGSYLHRLLLLLVRSFAQEWR